MCGGKCLFTASASPSPGNDMGERPAASADAVRSAADRAEARAEKRDRPTGRGRLSSIDQLPEEAQEDVIWAVGELNRRQRTQADILFELNDRLGAKGVDPISKSAFNRSSMRLAAMSSRLNEARRIFEGLAPQFTPERVDENTIALGEFIKLLVFELAQNEGETLGTKGAMELARAHLAVIQGQKISTERPHQADEKHGRQTDRGGGNRGRSGRRRRPSGRQKRLCSRKSARTFTGFSTHDARPADLRLSAALAAGQIALQAWHVRAPDR